MVAARQSSHSRNGHGLRPDSTGIHRREIFQSNTSPPVIRAILKQPSLAALLTLVIFLVPTRLQAQADLPLSIKPAANGQLQLSWPVKSLVPAPGRAVFADYQVAVSTDLK